MSTQLSGEKQLAIDRVIQKLKDQKIEHRLTRGSTHIIVYSPTGEERIDLWPTTGKWMRQGQGVSYGMHVFWKAVEGWGTSDGA